MAKESFQPEQLSAQSQELFDVLNKSDDLVCIIVGASWLDATLESFLRQRFVNKEVEKRLVGGPLGGYSAKVDLAYGLGLFSKHTYEDLRKIGEIRNSVAHSHFHLTFKDEGIQKKCSVLKKWKIVPHVAHPLKPEIMARSQFTISVAIINSQLLTWALSEKTEKK